MPSLSHFQVFLLLILPASFENRTRLWHKAREKKKTNKQTIIVYRRIYTTFILGTALLNFGPRANIMGHGPLDICHKVLGPRAR